MYECMYIIVNPCIHTYVHIMCYVYVDVCGVLIRMCILKDIMHTAH